jgi:hypothetical protein
MCRTILAASLLIAFTAGCDTDCADTSRLNGTYAMWHNVLNMGAAGTATVSEDYPAYQMFINGWSKWTIKASTSGGTFNTDILDVAEFQGDYNDSDPTTQAFAGTLTASDTNCNSEALHLEGEFNTTSGTVHTFTYDAETVYVGDHITGTFTYTDTYAGADGSSGGLTGAEGELNGTLQVDGFDTGFSD